MLAASTLNSVGGGSKSHDMHFQSHLQDYRQPTAHGVGDMGGGGMPNSYQGRYAGYGYGYGYGAESGSSHGGSYLNAAQRIAAPPPSPLPPSSFMHYNSLYNAHYMNGTSAASGLYGQRARYLPYQAHPHQSPHAPPPPSHRLREMFTPAGQQLIPTSVLHYPPRHNPYQQQQQQQHYYTQQQMHYRQQQLELQQQRQQSPYHSHLYESSSTPSSLYGQQQHNQRQQHPFHPIQQPAYSAPLNDYYNATPYTLPTSSFYRSNSPLVVAPHDPITEKDSLAADNNNERERERERESLVGAVSSNSNNSTECLTTSPPLISATGTDSGISSCSMRARSDDSTRSTPIYNSEYPPSVGSSSGVSFNYNAEGKDYEEHNRERVEGEAQKLIECSDEKKNIKVEKDEVGGDGDDVIDAVKVKTEPIETTDHESVARNSKNDAEKSVASENSPIVSEVKELQMQAINKAATGAFSHSQRPQQQHQQQQQEQIKQEQHEQKQQINDNKTVTGNMAGQEAVAVTPAITTNSSPTSERCTTPFPKTQILHASQAQQPQQQQQQQQQSWHRQQPYASPQMQAIKSFPSRNINNNNNNNNNNINNNNSWHPYPSSPSNWLQQNQCNAKYKREQVWSPPPVPVPPHNSPVGYSYPACATPVGQSTAAIASTSVTTKKQRVIECDLIPSKKSKRKPNTTSSTATTKATTSTVTSTTTATTKTSAIPNADEDDDESKEMRDMMPLPGFQQAFGSTEIGRFSETFLRTPSHDNLPTEEAYFDDYYNTEPTAYMMPPQHAMPTWPPTSYVDAYDYESRSAAVAAGGGGSTRGVGKYNLHFDARSAYAMRDYLAYERYNYGYGRGGRGSFNEIRCNGY